MPPGAARVQTDVGRGFTVGVFLLVLFQGGGAAAQPPGLGLNGLLRRQDPAERAAQAIALWASRLPAHREMALDAVWTEDREAMWSIRAEDDCLESLRAQGIAYRRLPWHPPLIPTPVEIRSDIGGVTFRKSLADRPFIVACELATRLPVLAEVLADHDVREVVVMSAWRRGPSYSFHRAGLAIDVSKLVTESGERLSIEHDFVTTPGQATCAGDPPADRRARILRDIVCDLDRARTFSTIITPNYNEGHRDHLHLDVRPDDPRFFLR
jgi:hypothetical protein